MAKYFFILLFLMTPMTQAQCRFSELSLSDIEEGDHFTVFAENGSAFPETLFNNFKKELGVFSLKECTATGVLKKTFSFKNDSAAYTAFYTNEDICDGGNAYGVIVRGQAPEAGQVIAIIQDSFITCVVR